MNAAERRLHPRFNPWGLKAKITFDDANEIEGDVVDISLTGIKIKLATPAADDLNGKIKIALFLPETGIPFSITGILKHRINPVELGLHYVENPEAMSSFMLECIKLVKN